MNFDPFESQINKRRRYDEEMYQGAFADLLSVLGIKGQKAIREVKGSVSEILKFLGQTIPDIPENITDLDAQLNYMLRPSGTMRRRIELVGKWWKDSTGCILGSTKSGEVIALIPNKWSGYEYKNADGKIIKVNEKTAKEINIDAFCFYKGFPQTKLKIKDLMMFMAKILSISDILFMVGATAAMQLLSMLTPYTTKIIYSILIPSGSTSLIGSVTSLLVGITIGTTLLSINKSIIETRIQNKLNLSVNSAIMMRMFSLPATFFKDYSAGELASRMGYIASLCQMIAGAVLSTGLTAIFSLGYLFQMNHYAPSLVMPGMTVIVLTIAFSVLITLMQQSIFRKKMKIAPKLQSLVYALFGGIQKIKVTGSEKRAFAKWAEQYSEVEKLDYSPPIILKISSVISMIISSLGLIVIYYFAAISSVSLSDYQSFSVAYGGVNAAITALAGIALQIANLGPILEMIKPIMECEPESSEGRKIVTSLSGDIDVNHIKFKYTEDGPLILDDINIKIKKGEYVAIVGQTGCGKSTLLRLLLGFEKPEQGAIYYGGKDINSLDPKSLRQKIGVVMQNGSLFPGDIFSNIIVTSPWKTLDDAWEAAYMAGIDKDIKAMPMGMHTMISEGAGGISGGQKQRIMIARSIISKPAILFFDEATSALDNITQHHVSESISKLNCTRFVIAHRLSTIKNCDRILVMDKGKIVEEGNFESLMEKKGKFYELAVRQIAK